jgi:hypothetical protein
MADIDSGAVKPVSLDDARRRLSRPYIISGFVVQD